MFKKLIFIFTIVSILSTTNSYAQQPIEYIFPGNESIYNSVQTSIIIRLSKSLVQNEISKEGIRIQTSNCQTVDFEIKLDFTKRSLEIKPITTLPQISKIKIILLKHFAFSDNSTQIIDTSWSFYTGKLAVSNSFAEGKNALHEISLTGFDNEYYTTDGNLDSVAENQLYTKMFMVDSIPPLIVTVYDKSKLSEGYYFISNSTSSSQFKQYNMIIDNEGKVIYHKTARNFLDFKKLHDGRYSYFATLKRQHIILDSLFNANDTVKAVNGYTSDSHELITDRFGNYAILAFDSQEVDMTKIAPDGKVNAIVLNPVIQILNPQKQLIFQWNGLGNIPITDATNENLTDLFIDYIHPNALEWEKDSTILMSGRHINEITRISLIDGKILGRFGNNSKGNDFTIIGDSEGFRYQHDIRKAPNGNYTIFDNGNFKNNPRSRVVEYNIDFEQHTATLVNQFANSPSVFSTFMGSAQQMENGNYVIGWGGSSAGGLIPTITEVSPNGEKLIEIKMPSNCYSYRAQKFNINNLNNLKPAVSQTTIYGCLRDSFTFNSGFFKTIWDDGATGLKKITTNTQQNAVIINNKGFTDFVGYDFVMSQPQIEANDTVIKCEGYPISLTISGGNCAQVNYIWSDGFVGKDRIITEEKSGYYKLTMSNATKTIIDSVYIQLITARHLLISGQTALVEPNNIYVYSIEKTDNTKCNWYVENGTLVAGNTGNTVAVQWGEYNSGKLIAVTTNINSCIDSSELNIEIKSSTNSDNINLINFSELILVSPNPFNNELTIKSLMNKHINIAISDLSGQNLFQTNFTDNIKLEMSNFKSGFYVLCITDDMGNLVRKKIIKN